MFLSSTNYYAYFMHSKAHMTLFFNVDTAHKAKGSVEVTRMLEETQEYSKRQHVVLSERRFKYFIPEQRRENPLVRHFIKKLTLRIQLFRQRA
jgi:hypothetical protein